MTPIFTSPSDPTQRLVDVLELSAPDRQALVGAAAARPVDQRAARNGGPPADHALARLSLIEPANGRAAEVSLAARQAERAAPGAPEPAAAPAPADRRWTLGSLPTPPTRLIGRGWEPAEVARLLRHERRVMRVGPGGSGKTRLALEMAGRLRDHVPDGIWFVDLSATRDPAVVLPHRCPRARRQRRR